jgi:hypothetical protein
MALSKSVKTFISERISKHSECEFHMETDEDLPPCTPEEMWGEAYNVGFEEEGWCKGHQGL